MMTGPEFQPGWRDRLIVDGVTVQIEARHYPRQRLPRGHEIARQMARRGMVQMVEDPVHEWRVTIERRQFTIRPVPSGFQIAGAHKVYRTLREAAVAKVVVTE